MEFQGLFIPSDLIAQYGAKNACQLAALHENAPLVNKDAVIRRLKRMGLLESKEYTPHEVREILIGKNLLNTGIGEKCCAWCQTNTYTLHSHHFPVYKSFGGIDTVDICPNCHQEYHTLMSKLNFKIIPKILSLFNLTA